VGKVSKTVRKGNTRKKKNREGGGGETMGERSVVSWKRSLAMLQYREGNEKGGRAINLGSRRMISQLKNMEEGKKAQRIQGRKINLIKVR